MTEPIQGKIIADDGYIYNVTGTGIGRSKKTAEEFYRINPDFKQRFGEIPVYSAQDIDSLWKNMLDKGSDRYTAFGNDYAGVTLHEKDNKKRIEAITAILGREPSGLLPTRKAELAGDKTGLTSGSALNNISPIAGKDVPTPATTKTTYQDKNGKYFNSQAEAAASNKALASGGSTIVKPPVIPTATPPVVNTTLLKQGTGTKVAPSESVRAIQKQLGITADGIFGPQTKSAVMAFQQKNGLVVDGIVGPKTQAALQQALSSGGVVTTPPTTTKPADDPSNKYNTDTGKLNPKNTDAQAEIAKMNEEANSKQEEDLSSYMDSLGTKIDVSDSSKILKALADSVDDRPDPVSLVDTLNKKRKELGVGKQETELADLDTQIAQLDQQITDLFETEDDRMVSMTQIGRRKSEEQRLYEKARNELQVKRTGIVNELNQKYSVIDGIMKYTSADYENAVDDYNTKFTQAINLTNLLRSVDESNKSDAEKKADNARTNLQIMVNTLKDKNVDYGSLDSGTLLNIKNLELQSGLPSGFVKFAMEATDDPIVSMGSEFTNASNQRQVPVYTKNPSTGVVSVKILTLGTSSGDKLTESEKNKTEADDIASAILDFQTQIEKKGWAGINPDAYAYYKAEILKNYGSSAVLKFDKAIKDADLIVDNR